LTQHHIPAYAKYRAAEFNVRTMNMNRCISIVLLCGLLAGCGATVDTEEVQGGVIFPASKADFAAHATGRKDLQYWMPAQTDVANAVPHIKAFLAKEAPSIASRFHKYRCQYFGIVVEGKKRMYCNFFHRDGHAADWQTDPLIVLDGGDRYFQLEYDMQSKRCLNFIANGEA